MAQTPKEENSRMGSDPAQRNEAPDQPENDRKESVPREGEYRNVETGTTNPEQFNDEYESRREDQLSEEEARREKEGKTSKD